MIATPVDDDGISKFVALGKTVRWQSKLRPQPAELEKHRRPAQCWPSRMATQ
jgi:hypothetical protein